MSMDITLRRERPEDYRVVEELTREAFWGKTRPDCDEHLLAHRMRAVPAFVPELDWVAEAGGQIVGNILYTLSKIVTEDGAAYETLSFGPLSVLPAWQNRGVGGALLTHTIAEAKRLGYRAILFFGHPDYYPRYGFRRASEFHVTTSTGDSFDAFMAMPLFDGALDGITGRYYEDPVFEISEEDALAFDKTFPPKERRDPPSAALLLEALPPEAADALREHKIAHLGDMGRYSQRETGRWNGMDAAALETVRAVMRISGYRWGEKKK